jgi:hypothetical protein
MDLERTLVDCTGRLRCAAGLCETGLSSPGGALATVKESEEMVTVACLYEK